MTLNPLRFPAFVAEFTKVARLREEAGILTHGTGLLRDLVSCDDWLPARFRSAAGEHYSQYLLYRDAEARFSVVAFVWRPDEGTPVHDHTVWGMVGVLAGCEINQEFDLGPTGELIARGPPVRMFPGDVACFSPGLGDIHQVRNGLPDQPSVSIHVYGGDIGRIARSSFGSKGERTAFISGYSDVSDTQMPAPVVKSGD